MKALIGLAMVLATPQPLPEGATLGFTDGGGHLVLTRNHDRWNFEYLALPKDGNPMDVPVEAGKLHFVMTHEDGGTILTVTNGFETGYRYKAYVGDEKRQVPTSTCTVMAGRTSIEHWSDEIETMLLIDFEPSNELACRE